MTTPYDDNNIFAKILRDEIPTDKVLETEHALAFKDISEQAPVHVLIIPKTPCVTLADFVANASPAAQAGLLVAIAEVIKLLDLEAGGYRLIANNGTAARQEVMHLHFHVLGGRDLGGMLPE